MTQRFPVPPWRYRLARVAEQRVGSFTAQELANTAWAFATVSETDTALFAALARIAQRQLGGFSAQDLANTAWVFATVSESDAALFAALASIA